MNLLVKVMKRKAVKVKKKKKNLKKEKERREENQVSYLTSNLKVSIFLFLYSIERNVPEPTTPAPTSAPQ